MDLFIKVIFIFFVATAPCLLDASNASELNAVLKELIEVPLSEDDIKVKLDVLNYEVKENHIANMGVSFEVDCKSICCPFIKLKGQINARHPQLGTVDEVLQSVDKDAVLVGQFEMVMRSSLENAKNSNYKGLIDAMVMMSPLKVEIWEDIFSKEIEEAKSQKDLSEIEVSIEPRIVRKNTEGLIESFAVVVRHSGQIKGSKPCEYEFLVNLKTTSLDLRLVQINSSKNLCIFDDHEQNMMLALDRLQKRDPAIVGQVKKIVQSLNDYFRNCSTK